MDYSEGPQDLQVWNRSLQSFLLLTFLLMWEKNFQDSGNVMHKIFLFKTFGVISAEVNTWNDDGENDELDLDQPLR